MNPLLLQHPTEQMKRRTLAQKEISEIEPLLVEVMKEGRLVYDLPTIEDMRRRRQADVERLDPGVRRLMYPHIYHVSLTERLWQLKRDLITAARQEHNQKPTG